MEAVLIVLFLLFSVVVSNMLARFMPLPVPLIQITLGALISFVGDFGVILKPELFFLLFLPPLLFLDGWRIPKEGLKRDKWTVLELALGLVVFTVLGVGYFIYRMIPAMTLPVAFALAAVLSPTDPVAVSAIAKRISIPKRLMHILEGESLLNDASGLVSMKFAVTAAMSAGAFSIVSALAIFTWTAVVGLAIGALTTFAIIALMNFWSSRFGEDSGVEVIVSLLTPFAAYLLAEELHASGILAAVSGGISMSYAVYRQRAGAATRTQRVMVWDTVQYIANGAVFVLLGEQLPQIISGATSVAQETGHNGVGWLVLYVLAINFALAFVRFVWVWFSLRFSLSRAYRTGLKPYTPDWRLIVATSLAGVRGTVTLAGVLTLPLFLPDGTPFPGRDLAIFLATGVIIVSLVMASIFLPYLLKNVTLPPEPSHQKEEDRARASAAEAAIKAVEQAVHSWSEGRADADLYAEAGARIMKSYRDRLAGLSGSDEEAETAHKIADISRLLQLEALKAERNVYYSFARRHQLSEDAMNRFVREVDYLEARFSGA